MSMKNSNDNIAIQTGDLPAYSVVPQRTAAPRFTTEYFLHCIKMKCINLCISK